MNAIAQRRRDPAPARAAQRGTVLLFSLIILVVMLISSVALVRSFDTTLNTAGNLAFKRDLAQQSEEATQTILTQFRAGGLLVTATARANNMIAQNYSATVLPSNAQGIPLALLGDAAFAAVGTASTDIKDDDRKIALRYVVDRLCTSTGEDAALGSDDCTVAEEVVLAGGSQSNWQRAETGSGVAAGGSGAGLAGAVALPVVYRLSIRATGPRNTQSFFQTTFSCCDN
jgi:hypothetical protein